MTNDASPINDPSERELFEFEKKKFETEILLKQKNIENEQKSNSFQFIKSPFILAVLGGMITIIVNSTTSYYSTQNTIELEKEKLQSELIRKYLEPVDLKTRTDNMNFLAKAGLIPRYRDQIERYLKDYPNAIPQTALAASISNDGKSFGSSNILDSKFLEKLNRIRGSLVIVQSRQSAREWMKCTGVLVDAETVVTIGYCAAINLGTGPAGLQNLKVQLNDQSPLSDIKEVKQIGEGNSSEFITVMKLVMPSTGKTSLEIDDHQASIGQKLILPFLNGNVSDFLASFDDDCRVTDLKDDEIAYRCDGDAGSGGAPIISFETGKILGIHSKVTKDARWGIRLSKQNIQN